MKAKTNCPKCGKQEAKWLDSIPYCPKCGKPMTEEDIDFPLQ